MKKPKTRAAFTDGSAPAPKTMAVDATPRAGDSLRTRNRSPMSIALGVAQFEAAENADEPEEG